MWIGSSIFFNWLDGHLDKVDGESDGRKGVDGELFMVHSGGFYHVEKKLIAPAEMPKRLHWFKWEAAFTLLTGWLLLDIVFFQGGGATLIDPNVSSLSSTAATGVCIATLIGSWFVYDVLWRSPIRNHMVVGAAVTYALVVIVLWQLSSVLSGRAAFLMTGAMMGTWMATNVWVHIIPAQKGLVAAVTAGRRPDDNLAKHAKTRSRHNNYMTYPVVLIMLSNHFPGVYGSRYNWVILAGLMVVGSSVRHVQNKVKDLSPGILIAVLAAALTVTHSSLTSSSSSASGDVGASGSGATANATEPASTGGVKQVANEATVGQLKGVVRLEGEAPANRELNLGTCTSTAAPGSGAVHADTVLVKDKKLRNSFVYVKRGLEAFKGAELPDAPVVMDQKGCVYHPHVVGARVGQKVVFLNSDPVLHNVRTVAEHNLTFNDMMPTKDTSFAKTFDTEEVMVRAKCDVHPWMSAFLGIVPHPFFAVSNETGDVDLRNLPAGDYELEAWHEVFGRQSQKVVIEARKTTQVAFTFRAE